LDKITKRINMDKSQIIMLEKTESTNQYAFANFAKLSDSSLIVAKEQSEGRGRRGRKWLSPPGNIYASFVIKQSLVPAQNTYIGAVSAIQTLRQFAPDIPFWIKWPNDIFTKSLKIAGILSERHCPENYNKSDGAIVGIGINLNVGRDYFETNRLTATSVYAETGKEADILKFAIALHSALIRNYAIAVESPDLLFKAWKKENILIGKNIDIIPESGFQVSGVFKDIGKDGSLVLILPDGHTRKLYSGDVSLRKS
jgi:BirA family transcriptional regulator, biotin operon repressor / biotin---[acetyl-CoA-carboxylase] ligase